MLILPVNNNTIGFVILFYYSPNTTNTTVFIMSYSFIKYIHIVAVVNGTKAL